jgi:predicted transcriptional regulator
MAEPKLTKLELQIMETLWTGGASSIREIQEAFPEKGRPAYTTIQTTVYRLEVKNAVRRVKKVGNFHIFEASVSREAAQRRGERKSVPTVAIESGTYKQSGTAKTVEGRYLVLLVGGPTWVIAQQALTAKPEPQTLSRNLDEGTR